MNKYIVKRYFFIQHLTLVAIGIDPQATAPQGSQRIIKYPWILVIIMFLPALHYISIAHFVFLNSKDYAKAAESFSLSCQGIISLTKLTIFLYKRREIFQMVTHLQMNNDMANSEDLPIISRENAKDVLSCTVYSLAVAITGLWKLVVPVLNLIYVYVMRREFELIPPHPATYFWEHQHIQGYSLVYLWNVITVYSLGFGSVAIDSLFSWMVCNIVAQFRILAQRFQQAAAAATGSGQEQAIIHCIKFHTRTLELADELSEVYGAIIFVKFVVSGMQICCLAFCLCRGVQSLSTFAYQCLFLAAVALQLILYCYNGQRITDESLRVASEIYAAFEWSHLAKTTKKLLLIPMMRSLKFSELRGVFFTVDLSLYLWVFKTAGSLIAALKTLDENQD